jgi:hypothetical protein
MAPDPNVRVLLGTERFSSKHSWSELTTLMPRALQTTVAFECCSRHAFASVSATTRST